MVNNFGSTDVGRVQESFKRGKQYHVDNRLSDGQEYCVAVIKYHKDYIAALTPETLARIAVY